jgi:hypothetical protein
MNLAWTGLGQYLTNEFFQYFLPLRKRACTCTDQHEAVVTFPDARHLAKEERNEQE